MKMNKRSIAALHGTVCNMPNDFFGYFGWPSVTLMPDNTLVVVASGLRNDHMCPFGRTVLMSSQDGGQNWSVPRVINDSPLDDRDAGVISLGGQRLLVTWFTADRRPDYQTRLAQRIAQMGPIQKARWLGSTAAIKEEHVPRFCGSWVRHSEDGGATWESPIRVPVTSPHGCIQLRNGDLCYLGKGYQTQYQEPHTAIFAIVSHDDGRSWEQLGQVPLPPGVDYTNCHEPHVVELPSGNLLGVIRVQNSAANNVTKAGYIHFSMFSTISQDAGRTWTPMQPMGFAGSPPHLLLHSTGLIVLSYGYRLPPYGQRIAFSNDEGRTWHYDWILRDDGPDTDLGYPCTVELSDGSLFTVYYQKNGSVQDKCALLYSHWHIPTGICLNG
jgi:sialidase-1